MKTKPDFKSTIKHFWSKKEGKILVFSLTAVLILTLAIGVFIFYKTQSNQKTNQTIADERTTITASVDSLENGSPLTLIGEDGGRISIQNGQSAQVAPGKYTLQTQVDGENGEVKGIKEQVTLSDKENKKLNLTLKPIVLDETKALAKALPAATETKQILNLKPLDIKNNTSDSTNNSNSKVSYPSLVLPKSSSTESVAVLQPSLAKYNLVDTSGISTPTQIQNTNNVPAPKLEDNKSSTPKPSNIAVENASTLIASNKDGQVALAQGCDVQKVSFDDSGTILKYFKACDNGQNGFYQYDLVSKKEIQILPTSKPENILNVDNSSKQNITAWTNSDTGSFGVIKDGDPALELLDAYFTAPTFSPDGKYIILMDNYLARLSDAQKSALKLTTSNEDQFGLNVRVVNVDDLLKNKDKADFKLVGKTYYIPRVIDYQFDFVYFIDNNRFMAGDGSKIFSINGDSEDTSLVSDQPGRVFEASNGSKYRLYQNVIFNDKNEPLVGYVSKLYQLQNKQFYFKVGDFLFRLVDDTPVQAYSKPISSASVSQNNLQLILTDGQIVKF